MKRYEIKADADAGWNDRLRAAISRYEAGLLRAVGDQLVRLQSKRPVAEIIDKIVETVGNTVVLDRRLKELDAPARSLLGLVGLSHRPRWRLGGLLELLSAFAVPDGMAVIFSLFDAGLLFPELPDARTKLKSFAEWLGHGNTTGFAVFTHPTIAARALVQWLAKHHDDADPFSSLKLETVVPVKGQHEADGIEFFLRLGALWQQIKGGPLRLTQNGEFFKRDQERLAHDPLLIGPAADQLTPLPHMGHLLVAMGLQEGLLHVADGEVVAGEWPADGPLSLPGGLRKLWAEMTGIESWEAEEGWRGLYATGSPFGAAAVLTVALLAKLPHDEWAVVDSLAHWLVNHHCYWAKPKPVAVAVAKAAEDPEAEAEPQPAPEAVIAWMRKFVLGVAYQLRLVTVAKSMHRTPHLQGGAKSHPPSPPLPKGGEEWVARLSPMGRGVLGLAPPPNISEFPKTLLVQPNLEMIAYRQGLTPELIANLSRFATWKTLGPACTLQLDPESIYRGLEAGMTWEKLVQTLQRHSARELPAGVLQSLRTWADKRERLTVYGTATLMEFNSPEELQTAISRGLPGFAISDRIALVADESAIEFREFRLLGTRDYGLPPDRCIDVADDGVTLAVDVSRADLLLETELQRFARPMANGKPEARRTYQLTPESLARAREGGLNARTLDEWFKQRTGHHLPAATRLLLSDAHTPPLIARTQIVVEVPSSVMADGLMQWPETRRLITSRLGPQALVVAKSDLAQFESRMRELHLTMKNEE